MNSVLIAEPKEPRAALPRPVVVTSAELAECTCPDWCERDHEND